MKEIIDVSLLSQRCHEVFKRYGLSLRTLSFLLNMSPATLRRFFNNPKRVRTDTLLTIYSFAKELETSPACFVNGSSLLLDYDKIQALTRKNENGKNGNGRKNGDASREVHKTTRFEFVNEGNRVCTCSVNKPSAKSQTVTVTVKKHLQSKGSEGKVYKYVCRWCGSSFITNRKTDSCVCPFCSRTIDASSILEVKKQQSSNKRKSQVS